MASSTHPPNPAYVAAAQSTALRHFARPADRRAFLDRTAERRSRRVRDGSGFDRVPIALVDSESRRHRADRHPRKVPVVADELVAPANVDLGPGLVPVPDALTCCDEHVVYRASADAVVDVVAVWRENKVNGARLNGIATLGDTVKGPNDPRPAEALDPHPGGGEDGDAKPFVVVIDTGLDADAHTSGWLTRPDVSPVDANIDIDPKDAIISYTGQAGSDGVIDPCAGHGTFVAGVIRRVAPTATVRMLRAVDSEGFASDAMVAAAICRSVALFEGEGGRGVLNLSLGGETPDDEVPAILACALDKLPDDVVVVAAAGNEPTGVPVWPAAADGVEGVAALDVNDQPAAWSNRGDTVDFTVRGEGIISTYVDGTDASGDRYGADPFAIWTGTSFATPQVAALIAQRLVDHPDMSADDLVDELRGDPPDADWGTIITGIPLVG